MTALPKDIEEAIDRLMTSTPSTRDQSAHMLRVAIQRNLHECGKIASEITTISHELQQTAPTQRQRYKEAALSAGVFSKEQMLYAIDLYLAEDAEHAKKEKL